jgi:hypothetical protein
MRNSSKILKRAIVAAKQTLQSLLDLDAQVAKGADLMEESLRAGNKLLVCGNGGSAADASHFATEFVVRFTKDRPVYPAICLSGDGELLTAAGKDYGFRSPVAAFGLFPRKTTPRVEMPTMWSHRIFHATGFGRCRRDVPKMPQKMPYY